MEETKITGLAWRVCTIPSKSGIYLECPKCGSRWSCRQNETHRFAACPSCATKLKQPKI